MDRQEGYYWVKKYNTVTVKYKHEIALFVVNEKLDGISSYWMMIDSEETFYDEHFEHINEVRIKFPGELPD